MAKANRLTDSQVKTLKYGVVDLHAGLILLLQREIGPAQAQRKVTFSKI